MIALIPHKEYFPAFAAVWALLAVGGYIAVARIKVAAAKLRVVRVFTVAAGLLFLGGVLFLSGDMHQLLFASVPVTAITVLNLAQVRVCPNCCKLLHPRNFVPPRHCERCGAALIQSSQKKVGSNAA